jgi:glycerophosphoryl diester phosphodiesterase
MRFSPQVRHLSWLVERPIAHRGLHDRGKGIIENTASAFASAIAGNYAIECDLQVTADGEAVIFHDETLDRLTEATGLVNAHTVNQLKEIAFKNSGDRILTLAELLNQVSGRVPLIIELKSHWDADCKLTERTLSVLESYAGPYALMSFDPDIVACIRELSPGTVRGIVADRTTGPEYCLLPLSRRLELRQFSHGARTQPHFISFHWRDLPYAAVNRFRSLGGPVITWTIRTPEQATLARRYSDQVTFEGFRA